MRYFIAISIYVLLFGQTVVEAQDMNVAQYELALGYLRVLLSAPPMTVVIVLVLVCVFRDDLSAIMSRIATIKFPGGELSTTSQKDRPTETGPNELPQGATGPDAETALPDGLTLTPQQQELLRDFIQAQQATSRLWEYRYLNFYFVRSTQLVLDWLASLQNRPSIEMFDALWLPAIPSADDRKAVLAALQNHNLITVRETMLEITGKGREYLQWRGPLPAP